MYCKNCGAKIDEHKKFCDNCGSATEKVKPKDYKEVIKTEMDDIEQPYQPTPPAIKRKNIFIALLLSTFFFPGFGVVYANKTGRGFFYMFSIIGLIVLSGLFLIGVNELLGIILFGFVAIFYLWIEIDTILLANKYNKFVKTNFRKPRKDEKWWK